MGNLFDALEQAKRDQDRGSTEIPAGAERKESAGAGRGFTSALRAVVEANAAEFSTVEGNLLSAGGGREIKTVFITSSRPGEGKTVSAISTAYALSRSGGRILLVDGNLGNPTLHAVFGSPISPGLTDLLLGQAEEKDVLRATPYDNIWIMPRGSDLARSSEAVFSDPFSRCLAQLRKDFDYVVFDADSVLTSSDACVLAKHFDGVLFVVECEKTKWQVLELAKEKIMNVGGNAIGVIMNKRRHYIPNMLYGRI